MGMRCSINPFIRSKMVLLHAHYQTIRIQQSGLCSSIEVLPSHWPIKRSAENGCCEKTSLQTDRQIHRTSGGNWMLTVVNIWKQLFEEIDIIFASQTVRSRLKVYVLFRQITQKKPMISKNNWWKRIKFAKNHIEWRADDWSKYFKATFPGSTSFDQIEDIR